MQTDATTPNIVGPTMLGVVASVYTWLKVWTISNFAQQLPKFWRNLMQQGVQTDAACNIQQCCVRLHGALKLYGKESRNKDFI